VKIGFLGGSFDPIHFGHLCAAQDAHENMGLDKVIFVPAAQAPLKPGLVCATDQQRFDMIERVVSGDPRFEVSDYELRKGGVSYTIESVRHFRQMYPFEQLFWIIGGDQLARLPLWVRIEELVRMVEFICLDRPGNEATPAPAIPGLRLHRCPGHLLQISSTEIRDRAARNLPLDCLMPHKAIVYLKENTLYR
jgi:nicotinate-nucleotide adenylyltransferase